MKTKESLKIKSEKLDKAHVAFIAIGLAVAPCSIIADLASIITAVENVNELKNSAYFQETQEKLMNFVNKKYQDGEYTKEEYEEHVEKINGWHLIQKCIDESEDATYRNREKAAGAVLWTGLGLTAIGLVSMCSGVGCFFAKAKNDDALEQMKFNEAREA